MTAGGIYVANGDLDIDSCNLTANTAKSGGGILNDGVATITNCTFTSNAAGTGGGVYNTGMVSIANSTFVNNSASGGAGGAIYTQDHTASITNCTFTGNSAKNGGAVANELGVASITNCTISGNAATGVGGAAYSHRASQTVLLNCIAYGDQSTVELGSDTAPAIIATYSDILGGYKGTGNINSFPLLALLFANGGPTMTMAIGASSPCLGAGLAADAPATDQRGLQRPAVPSMGAFDAGTVPAPTIMPGAGTVASGQLVAIADTFDTASIYFTTDGSTPTADSTVYSGQFPITSNVTIKAIAIASGFTSSPIMTSDFTIGIVHTFPAGIAMFSLPEDFGSMAAGAILGYSSPTLARWEPDTSAYDVTPAPEVATIVPGEGYWVRFPDIETITVPGTLIPSNVPFAILLHAGWNMVGDPFTDGVPVSGISIQTNDGIAQSLEAAVNSEIIGPTIWGFSGGSYIAADTLSPYQGYWVFASQKLYDDVARCRLGAYMRSLPQEYQVEIRAAL